LASFTALLRAQERLVHDSIHPQGCADWRGDCGVLASTLRMLLAKARAASHHLPTAEYNDTSRPQCNLIIVGDSHALQLFDSAVCGLELAGGRRLREHGWKDPRLGSHSTISSASLSTGVEQTVLTLPAVDGREDASTPLLLAVFINRNGMSDGLEDPLLTGCVRQAVQPLGQCTLVMYGEGAHSGSTPAPLFRDAVRAAAHELRSIATLAPRTMVVAWEARPVHAWQTRSPSR